MKPTKRKFILPILIYAICIVYTNLLLSQTSVDYQWYVNANGGATQAFCDVQEKNNHISKLKSETGLGYGVRFGRYISPLFTAHLQFLKANFKGQKESHDLKFKSNLMEYELGATINFSNLFFGKNPDRLFYFYGTTGFGMIFFRSEAESISTGNLFNDFGYTKDAERKKDNRESSFVIPLGIGVNYKLADEWHINMESVLRFSGTDKLDAVESGSHNDAYYYTSLGISYNFGKKKSKEIIVIPPEIVEVPEKSFTDEYVNLIYKIPRDLKSYDKFEMRCEIHKGRIDGKGELTQILPIGFNILDTVIGIARMDFKNYTLNLYWDELPKDSVFEVAYTVQLNRIFGNLPLTSILYLDKTNKDYKFKTVVFVDRRRPEDELAVQDTDTTQQSEAEEAAKKIEFRVQVRARYNAGIPLQKLANRYHLREEIKENYNGTWYRYSIGSFQSYDEAKDYRTKIIGEHAVRDAFIVAFMNGNRLDSLSELKEIAPEFYPQKTKFIETGTIYRVQILALLKNTIMPEILKEIYSIDEEVNEEVYNNWRKYTVGKFTSRKNAKKIQEEMINKGIIDAFIVVYKKGERIFYNGQ